MSKKPLIKESFIKMFGEWNKTLLKYMYGKDVKMVSKVKSPSLSDLVQEEEEEEVPELKFSIKGKSKDVKAYADAIMAEKSYLDSYVEFGKEHFQTIKRREILNQAVQKFEKTTGLMWPFKSEG
tara:strand:+ start:973 stop:1344 length:372 start_codon:yes stop_codon:yes gene_type:complete